MKKHLLVFIFLLPHFSFSQTFTFSDIYPHKGQLVYANDSAFYFSFETANDTNIYKFNAKTLKIESKDVTMQEIQKAPAGKVDFSFFLQNELKPSTPSFFPFASDAAMKQLNIILRTNIFGKVVDSIGIYFQHRFSNGNYMKAIYTYEVEKMLESDFKDNGGNTMRGRDLVYSTIYKKIYILALDSAGQYLWSKKIERKYKIKGNINDYKGGYGWQGEMPMRLFYGNKKINIIYQTKGSFQKQVFNFEVNENGQSKETELRGDFKNISNVIKIHNVCENNFIMQLKTGIRYHLVKVTVE